MTAKDIHREYKKLQRIRKFGRHKEVYFWLALVSLLGALLLVQEFPWIWIPAIGFFVLYFETKPKREMHRNQYHKLKHMVQMHQDALLVLIFSGTLDESEVAELIRFGGHGGSVARADNLHWADFMTQLRKRQSELPYDIQHTLDLQLQIHGW